MTPHLQVLEMFARAGIQPNAKAIAGKENLERRGLSPRHCQSCDRDDVETFPLAKTPLCRACFPLRMAYGVSGPGTGRFSKKAPTSIFLARDRVRIATSISPEHIHGQVEVTPANTMKEILREFVVKPPEQYAILTFGDAATPATDFRLNIDPNHLLFSGPGWGSYEVKEVNTDMVRYMLDAFTDLLGPADLYAYLDHKEKRADHKTVALVEDRYPELKSLRPPSSTSPEARITAYLLPALMEKTVVEKETAHV